MSDLVSCYRCGDYYPDQIEPCTHGKQLCGTCVDACTECLMEKL